MAPKKKAAQAKRIDFAAGFSDYVAGNQKVWEHDRSQTVGASEVFGCHRHNFFKKRAPELASEPEEVDPEWGHTERGNLIENEFVVPCLRSMFGEDNCFLMGTDQKTIVDGRLSATPDGVVVGLQQDALANYGVDDIGEVGMIATEVKSFGGEHAAPKKYKEHDKDDPSVVHIRYEPKPRHKGQNIVQMGLLRRKTNYQPDFGTVIYANPVNLKDVRIAPVKYDEAVYNVAKDRAEAVFDPDKTAKDFAAEGLLINECQYCDFVDACNAVEMERFPDRIVPLAEIDPHQTKELEELVRKVAKMRKDYTQLEKDKKVEEAKLKDQLFDIGTTRFSANGATATVSKCAGRKSVDKARIEEEFEISLEDYQKEGNPYFMLRTKADD